MVYYNKKSRLFNILHKWAFHGSILGRLTYSIYTKFILNCDIPYRTKIGDRLIIYHNLYGTVINPNAIIGDNVCIRHNTTIASKEYHGGETPVIGNKVEIGPNVVVIGNIHVADNTWIAAGAVVTKDTPEFSIVAGNPAKVIGFHK